MNIQKAQDKLYDLSEEYGQLMDQIADLNQKARLVMDERRKLLYKFCVLDLRRPTPLVRRKVWSPSDIDKWGEGVI